MSNRQVAAAHVATEPDVGTVFLEAIMHKHLCMQKICSHSVPKMLLEITKRVECSGELLSIMNAVACSM